MKKILFTMLIGIIVVSCNDKVVNKETNHKIEILKNENKKDGKLKHDNLEKLASEWDFMKVDIENFPVAEETSFDTYDESYNENHPVARVYTKLSKEQVRKLGLEKWLQNGSDVSVNYELAYSDDFKTFVFTYKSGEMELKTTMVTFDKNFKRIDEIEVAFDEIAESWLWTKSEIDKNQITVIDYNETGGDTVTTKSIYKISQEGKFVKQ